MVFDGFVELGKVEGNEEVQQNINFIHMLGQLIDMDELDMLLDP